MQVTGRLTDLSGVPMVGAPVEIQQFSVTLRGTAESTLVTANTAPDGSFSAAVPLTQNALVRALHRPAPAAVSTLVAIDVAPAITITVPSTSPLTVTGTVAPPTKTATVELFTVSADGRWQALRQQRVPVRQGAFAATLATPAAGEYGLSVHTPADAVSAAGVSAPVQVTVP